MTATSRTTSGSRSTTSSRVVAEAAGYEIPETTEFSMYMWSYFEKFIILLEPENMAKFMTRIFPQMMDAMPPGMAPMMRAMKYVPGGLAMMEKMMPAMFPAMAPGILKKVMPDMISEVEDYIGEMPEDMADAHARPAAQDDGVADAHVSAAADPVSDAAVHRLRTP